MFWPERARCIHTYGHHLKIKKSNLDPFYESGEIFLLVTLASLLPQTALLLWDHVVVYKKYSNTPTTNYT